MRALLHLAHGEKITLQIIIDVDRSRSSICNLLRILELCNISETCVFESKAIPVFFPPHLPAAPYLHKVLLRPFAANVVNS